jgi:VP3 protein
MESFRDTKSLSKQFSDELKTLNFKMRVNNTDREFKHYPKEEDLFYYCLGDSYQLGKMGRLMEVSSAHVDRFKALGFVLESERNTSTRTSVMRQKYISNVSNVIGVEPNGLDKISQNRRLRTFDTYDYPATVNVIEDFINHCFRRWNMSYPKELLTIQYGLVSRYSNDYNEMFKNLSYEADENEFDINQDFITKQLSARRHYRLKEYKLMNFGPQVMSPRISWSPVNKRTKNEYATKGLLYCHDFFVSIGDSPGNHYLKYANVIPRGRAIAYDPRPIAFESIVDYKQQYFEESDINEIVQIANELRVNNENMIIRIDIRSDKPTDFLKEYDVRWEDMVHSDNILTAKIVNGMPDNVTIVAKLRPSFNRVNSAPQINRPFRIQPQPYATITTSEFVLFVPSKHLNKTGLWSSYDYDDLINMQYQICALKRTCGRLYNMYLSDMSLNMGVIIGQQAMLNSTLALYSLSNVNNSIPNFAEFENFIVTYPYARVSDTILNVTSHNRDYSDNTVDITFECKDDAPLVIPVYSLPFKVKTSVQDIKTVIITDNELISYMQPSNQMSTQIVKLVSFILKNLMNDRGINYTEMDSEIRRNVLKDFVNKYKLEANLTGEHVYFNGIKMSISGHMQYILIGSVFGLPYGIKRYIKEIELNILTPGKSYERKLGGRVWHGFYSHYLAVESAMLFLSITQLFPTEIYDAIDVSFNWIRKELIYLADKYEVYRMVDERNKI